MLTQAAYGAAILSAVQQNETSFATVNHAAATAREEDHRLRESAFATQLDTTLKRVHRNKTCAVRKCVKRLASAQLDNRTLLFFPDLFIEKRRGKRNCVGSTMEKDLKAVHVIRGRQCFLP